MSRFLELCESLDPSNTLNIHAAWEAKNILKDHNVPVLSKGNDIYLHADIAGERKLIHLQVVGVKDIPKLPEEDEDVMTAVINASKDSLKLNPDINQAHRDISTAAKMLASKAKIQAANFGTPAQ
jgi:hypothetical protein